MIRKSSEKQVERKPAPFNGTGEIQMVELQFGNETWQVTNVTDSGFTYKTCENTGNQTLYFVIEITSIS